MAGNMGYVESGKVAFENCSVRILPSGFALTVSALVGHPSGEGIDLSDENELKKLLLNLNLDAEGLLAYAKSEVIRKEIHDSTVEAAEKYGVFGVPTMIVYLPHHSAEEPGLYFGNDQILTIRNLLDGGTDYMRSAPEALLNFIKRIPKKNPSFPERVSTSKKSSTSPVHSAAELHPPHSSSSTTRAKL